MPKKHKKKIHKSKSNSKISFNYIIFWPSLALAIKILLIFNIPNHIWLGADGESYVGGLNSLLTEGFFSKASTLIYWPAGYPLFMWPLAKISLTSFTILLGLFQTVVFAYSTFLFAKQLTSTKLRKYASITSFLISFNPTLSLSSLVIGYESIVASLLLLSVAIVMQAHIRRHKDLAWKELVLLCSFLSLGIFMQPRTVIFAIAMVLIYILKLRNVKTQVISLIVAISLTSMLPSVLIFRNSVANDTWAISTNLGTTMMVGAGDTATGGYGDTGGVPCEPSQKNSKVTENERVKCVLNWYLSNPSKSLKLAFNKSVYYWSPWSGPLTNGTMARNPWSKINPIIGIAKNAEGNQLVYGPVGKVISWLWLLGGVGLIFLGTVYLWRLGGVERYLGYLVSIPTFFGWFISVGTIGDGRFRIPQMGLSVFLQVVGFLALSNLFRRSKL
jgi:hypothetical protein